MESDYDIGHITKDVFYNKVIINNRGHATLRIDALTDNLYDTYRTAIHKIGVYLTGTSDEIKEDISPKEYKKLLVAEGLTPILLLPLGAFYTLIFSVEAVFRLMGRDYKYLYNDKYDRIGGFIGFGRI